MAPHGGPSAFVGRAAELAVLDGLFRSLGERGASTALVAGEAGVGKSRLVEQLLVRAEQAGATVAAGRTSVAGASLPYGAIVGLFRALHRQLDGSDDAQLLEAAQALLLADGSEVLGRVTRVRLFEAVLEAVDGLAATRPVVLVLEDLHWADTGSVDLLDHLVRNLAHQPVLVAATYRVDEAVAQVMLQRVLAELRRHPSVVAIDLEGLGRSEVAELARAVTGEPQPWVVVDAVYERSGGNPLFAEELVALRDRGSVPPVLRDLLRVRLGQLEPVAQPVVAAAAVLGTTAPPDLLSRVVGLDGATFETAVAAAVRGGVLVPAGSSRSMRFRHALLREVAHDQLLPAERARLHRQAAHVLTEEPGLSAAGPGAAAAELAEHHFEAGDWSEACAASIAAARAAMNLYSGHAAHVHMQRAVEAHGRAAGRCSHPEVDDAELHHRAANAAYLVTDLDTACTAAEAAFAGVDASQDPLRWARYGTTLARCAWDGRGHDAGFRVLEEVTARLRALPESCELSEAVTMRARLLMATGRLADCVAACGDAIELARRIGDRTSEGHALATLAPSLAQLGLAEEALAAGHEATALAEEVGDPDLLLRAYINLTDVQLSVGDLDGAAGAALAAIDDAGPLGIVRLSGTGQNGAEALVALGRWQQAGEVLTATARTSIAICAGDTVIEALLALRRGELDLAVTILDAQKQTSVQSLARSEMVLAEVELERGRPDLALTALDRALDLLAGTEYGIELLRAHSLVLRALADQAAGCGRNRRPVDRPKLVRIAELTLANVESMLEGHAEHADAVPWLTTLGALCRAEACRVGAEDAAAWDGAAAAFESFGDPYHRAYCNLRQAEALLGERGNRRRAAVLLDAACRTAVELGATSLVRSCERLAARARIALDAAVSRPPSLRQQVQEDLGLTTREIEVLELLALDRTDAQIADQLFISKKTASVHVSNILRKLDVADRWHAGELGRNNGLGTATTDPST